MTRLLLRAGAEIDKTITIGSDNGQNLCNVYFLYNGEKLQHSDEFGDALQSITGVSRDNWSRFVRFSTEATAQGTAKMLRHLYNGGDIWD